jgi:hypothetical protein
LFGQAAVDEGNQNHGEVRRDEEGGCSAPWCLKVLQLLLAQTEVSVLSSLPEVLAAHIPYNLPAYLGCILTIVIST